MHLQEYCLIYTHKRRGKKTVVAISGLAKFDFKPIEIIVLLRQRTWWSAEWMNTNRGKASSFQATCAHFRCLVKIQDHQGVFIYYQERKHDMYNYSGINMTGPGRQDHRVQIVILQKQDYLWKQKRNLCFYSRCYVYLLLQTRVTFTFWWMHIRGSHVETMIGKHEYLKMC